MPDQYTSTSTTGYGTRIVNSIKGIVIGLVLFIVSFGVLYWNEGRADLSQVAKLSTPMNAAVGSQNVSLDGKLVAATGVVQADADLGDGLFLNPGKYLAVSRQVEMYAWIEEESSKTTKNLGGSETTETTYTYKKEWTASPTETGKFAHPEGHENPIPALTNADALASSAKVGVYGLDLSALDLPSASKVVLNALNVSVSSTPGASVWNGEWIFIPKIPTQDHATPPELGDLRVGYKAVPSDVTMTVFGKLEGSVLNPFVTPKGNRLYRAFTESRDAAIASMHSEYTSSVWLLRLLGFILMWLGLAMLLGPVSVLLDILPIAGTISRSFIGIATFLIALAFSIVTIIISMIVHSLLALIIAIIVVVVAAILIMKLSKKKPQAAPPATPSTS